VCKPRDSATDLMSKDGGQMWPHHYHSLSDELLEVVVGHAARVRGGNVVAVLQQHIKNINYSQIQSSGSTFFEIYIRIRIRSIPGF
jgi:hypothetical protein